MHIRRLGIVLTEICAGALVKDVRYDSQSQEVKISLNVGSEPGDELNDYGSEGVADLVKGTAGVDLSGVVYFAYDGI